MTCALWPVCVLGSGGTWVSGSTGEDHAVQTCIFFSVGHGNLLAILHLGVFREIPLAAVCGPSGRKPFEVSDEVS